MPGEAKQLISIPFFMVSLQMDTSCQATRTSFWWDSQTAEFSCVLSHPSYVRPKSKTAAEGFGNFFFFFFLIQKLQENRFNV